MLAGYADSIETELFEFNEGLPSRFPNQLLFEDFPEEELRRIFRGLAEQGDWQLEQGVPMLLVDAWHLDGEGEVSQTPGSLGRCSKRRERGPRLGSILCSTR